MIIASGPEQEHTTPAGGKARCGDEPLAGPDALGVRGTDLSMGTDAARDRAEVPPVLAPRTRETLLRLIESHPRRKELLRHEAAVLRVAASLPQIRELLDVLAKTGKTPQSSRALDAGGLCTAGDVLAQFLEFVAFSTPEMKRLVAGEP